MKKNISLRAIGLLAAIGSSSASHATLIDFTGGTVTQFSGAGVTANNTNYNDADYYVEDGVKFDFIGPAGDPFSYHVGDYYNTGNDVIHGHWAAGPHGDMESIFVSKVDQSSFDLTYFKITSNTNIGGGSASGNEEVYINALADGTNVSYSMLLPSDDWGFAGANPEITLGIEFSNILALSFTYGSNAVGFGLDEFYIDEAAPSPSAVPIPAAAFLFGPALLGFMGFRRKANASA